MPYNSIRLVVMEKHYWHFERKKRIFNSKCDNIFLNSSASPWSSEMPLWQKGQTPSMQKWMMNEATYVVPEVSHCSGFNLSLQLLWKYNNFLVFIPPTAAMVWLGALWTTFFTISEPVGQKDTFDLLDISLVCFTWEKHTNNPEAVFFSGVLNKMPVEYLYVYVPLQF